MVVVGLPGRSSRGRQGVGYELHAAPPTLVSYRPLAHAALNLQSICGCGLGIAVELAV